MRQNYTQCQRIPNCAEKCAKNSPPTASQRPSPATTAVMPINGNSVPHLQQPSAAAAEAELRRVVNVITASLPTHPLRDLVSDIHSFPGPPSSCLEVLDRWMEQLQPPLCQPLKTRIKHLVASLLHHRKANSHLEEKREDGSLSDLVMALRACAADVSAVAVEKQREAALLRARELLFVPAVEIQDNEEYPSRKRRKTTFQQPARRSTRTFGLLQLGGGNTLKKRIGVGENFQAGVPDWTGRPPNEDPDASRFLGTKIWSTEKGDDTKVSADMIGKGKPQKCPCRSPGSVDCIKLHIRTLRLRLKSELGKVFSSWEFDKMGEEVSKSWTLEEQKMFHELVMKNPPSEGMSFWDPALEQFSNKSSREIASYYFNVFVLRRMRDQTRSTTGIVDSDDDESNFNKSLQVQASYTRSSQRSNRKKP